MESTECSAIVVDPFLEATTAATAKVSFLKAKAEDFANTDPKLRPLQGTFHQVLLKEVAHHLENRVSTFRGFYESIEPSPSDRPSLLIITRPQKDIDYPIWSDAKVVWAENQPSLEEFVSELEEAGFTDVSSDIQRYPCSIPLERWQAMVRNRFWSTFAGFSDEELDAACEAMPETERHRLHDGVIQFEDRLLFITASKR